jgi:hypothetical protein
MFKTSSKLFNTIKQLMSVNEHGVSKCYCFCIGRVLQEAVVDADVLCAALCRGQWRCCYLEPYAGSFSLCSLGSR